MEDLDPVADRIVEYDEIADMPFVRERPAAGGYLDAAIVETARQRIKRRTIGDLPAEEVHAITVALVDHEALLAVIHPERQRRSALVDSLQAEMARAEIRPILEGFAANPYIAQGLHAHVLSPVSQQRAWRAAACSRVSVRSVRVRQLLDVGGAAQ